ncbi:MAG: hypothetical protein H7259_03355, partial [Cytophagales bacterium]|nr:hypothetical protein [Cytophaga sp.]
MKFFKLVVIYFSLIAGGLNSTFAQQASSDITVNWSGKKNTVLLPDGSTVVFPDGKYIDPNEKGVLFLQYDIPGKISNIKEEYVTFMPLDSLSTAILKAITPNQQSSIQSEYLYNDGVFTRLYIPVLRSVAPAGLNRIATIKLSYTVSFEREVIPRSSSQIPSLSNARGAASSGSVLNNGDWYKLAVSESGIYRIDPGYLTSIGINPTSIDPNTIQIYGNGGGMLPQANSDARYDDLVENAVYINEDGNGIFDNNDYILFYGESPHVWQYDATSKTFSHELNLYSNQNFYFLTYGQNISKRISDQTSLPGTLQTVSSFDEHAYSETDLYNIIDSGREWYGDLFNQITPVRNYSFNNLNGAVTGGANATLIYSMLSRTTKETSVSIAVNGTSIAKTTLKAISADDHQPPGIEITTTNTLDASILGNSTTVTVSFDNGHYTSAVCNINYLELLFERNLALYNNQTSFRSVKSTAMASTQYVINSTTGTEMVWNITDPHSIVNQQYTVSGSTLQFGASSTTLNEYIVFKGSSFSAPSFIEKTVNQNLHGLLAADVPDMIIVSHPSFLNQAKRLASFRESNDGITCYIVTPEQIYNEFSSGKQDVTAIRDFVKMVYERGSGSKKLKYLLLFGNGSYDYKNIQNVNSLFVPTYESRESLDPLMS